MKSMEQGPSSYKRLPSTPVLWSLLFGLGPSVGGLLVVLAQQLVSLSQAFLMGGAAGLMLVLGVARPFQLLWAPSVSLISIAACFGLGAGGYGVVGHWVNRGAGHMKVDEREEVMKSDGGKFLDTPVSKAAMLGVMAIITHAWVEGLVLGVAALLAEGNIGLQMLAPVVLHSLPRGAAVAAIISALSKSQRGALLSSALSGFAGPAGAVVAMVLGLQSFRLLDELMVLASGALVLAGWRYLLVRAWRLDMKRTLLGLVMGAAFAVVSFCGTHVLCAHTLLCVAALDAVT
jgi:zinc transporter ZupT